MNYVAVVGNLDSYSGPACHRAGRTHGLSVEGTTNQCSWPYSSCGQATFDLDIGWE